MSNPNGYLSRSALDDLDKKKEKKAATPVVDNWQRLTVSQQAAQRADAEAKHTQNTVSQTKKTTTTSTTAKASQQNSMGAYNAASVLSLGKGPISAVEAGRLVQSGQASATVKNGQAYVSPKPPVASSLPQFTQTAAPKSTNTGATMTRREGSDNILDYFDRAEELASLPSWTSAQRKEAEQLSKTLERADTRRNIRTSTDEQSEWNRVSAELYNRTHPITVGFGSNLIKAVGADSVTEALLNGLAKLTGRREFAEASGQVSQELAKAAAYGQQTVPLASKAGSIAGGVALYAPLADLAGSLPALSGLSPVAQAATINGAALGSAAAVQGLGAASATGEWGGYARDIGLSAGVGAVSGAAMQVLFSALDELLRGAAASRRNKTYLQQDIDDVRQQYDAAVKALADPTVTPVQRAQLAQSTIDNANWASGRIDELIPNGGYEARGMQDALEGIVEEMKPYTSGSAGLLPVPQYDDIGWTSGLDSAIIQPEVKLNVPQPMQAEMSARASEFRDVDNNWGIIADRVANGEYDLAQKHQKYLQHIQGTVQYNNATQGRSKPQSFLTISEEEAQEIISRYSGTGRAFVADSGEVLGKEYVTTEKVVGKYFEKGEWHDTRRVQIIYSKDGTHIVPVKEK